MEIMWVRVRGRDHVDTVYPDGTSMFTMRTALAFVRPPFRATPPRVASSPREPTSKATAAAVAIAAPIRTGVRAVSQSRNRSRKTPPPGRVTTPAGAARTAAGGSRESIAAQSPETSTAATLSVTAVCRREAAC